MVVDDDLDKVAEDAVEQPEAAFLSIKTDTDRAPDRIDLTLKRVLAIVAEPDPEVRNHQITLAYWEMSIIIDEIIHHQWPEEIRNRERNINWFTMATWAVTTVGRNIRSRELPRRIDRLLPNAIRAQAEPWILSMRSSSGRRVAKALEDGQRKVFLSTMIFGLWFIEDFVDGVLDELTRAGGGEGTGTPISKDSDAAEGSPPAEDPKAARDAFKEAVRAALARRDAEDDGSSGTASAVDPALARRVAIAERRLPSLGTASRPLERGRPVQLEDADIEKLKNELKLVRALEHYRAIEVSAADAEIRSPATALAAADIQDVLTALHSLGIQVSRDTANEYRRVLVDAFTHDDGSYLDDLLAAFMAYRRAMNPDAGMLGDPQRCADQWDDLAAEIFRANLIITAVEQILLDNAVTTVVDHIPEELRVRSESEIAVWLEQVLRVPRSLGRLGAARRLQRLNELVREGWARFLTDQVLVLSLPTALVRVGRDLPLPPGDGHFFPGRLRTLPDVPPLNPVKGSNADQLSTEELFDLYDRSHADGWGTGAWDWRRFDERMNFAANLFRSRQQDPTMFWVPYNREDRRRVVQGEVPLRTADPAEQNVVPSAWEALEGVMR